MTSKKFAKDVVINYDKMSKEEQQKRDIQFTESIEKAQLNIINECYFNRNKKK